MRDECVRTRLILELSGKDAAKTPGEGSEGASAAALEVSGPEPQYESDINVQSAKKAASVVGGQEGQEGRGSIETK
jgi:hypothetical protein